MRRAAGDGRAGGPPPADQRGPFRRLRRSGDRSPWLPVGGNPGAVKVSFGVNAPPDPGRPSVFFPSLRQTIDDPSANTAPPEAGRDPFETGRVEPGPIDPGHLERLLLAARSPSSGEGSAPEFRSVVARSDAQRRELSAALAAQGLDQVSCGWLGSSGAVIVLLQPAERQERGFSGCLVRARLPYRPVGRYLWFDGVFRPSRGRGVAFAPFVDRHTGGAGRAVDRHRHSRATRRGGLGGGIPGGIRRAPRGTAGFQPSCGGSGRGSPRAADVVPRHRRGRRRCRGHRSAARNDGARPRPAVPCRWGVAGAA